MKPHTLLPTAACVLALLSLAVPAPAQEETGQEKPEKVEKVLKVAEEDELAPVRAIAERITGQLGEQLERLDLEVIMEGPRFFGSRPSAVRWDAGAGRLWFEWKRWDEEESGTYEYVPADDSLRRLSEDEAEMVPPARAAWDRERTKAAWNVRGSLMLYRGADKSTVELLSNMPGRRPACFSEDGKALVFEFMDNLIALALDPTNGSLLTRLTDIRKGAPPEEEPPTENQRWLKKQQLALFDFLDRRNLRVEKEKQRTESLSLKPFYLKGWDVASLEPSPDLAYVAVLLRKEAPQQRVADMPDYVTPSGYTETRKTRTKVGDESDGTRMALIEIATGASAQVDFGLADRRLAVWRASWSPNSDRVLVYLRAEDNKDAWLAVVAPAPGDEEGGIKAEVNTVAQEHDDAWVNYSVGAWLPDGENIYFLSERTGKRHIYTVGAAGGEAAALTSGDFEVGFPSLSDDRKYLEYSASLDGNPFEQQSFRLPVAGGEPEQLTSGMGRADAVVGPDGETMAVVASNINKPTELYIAMIGEAGPGKQITDSPSPAFKSYDWREPELVRFTARDGVEVPAQVYRPQEQHPSRPGVVFVHGAGYMQNVNRWWRGNSYGRVYCFHHLLNELGYTVIDIDYRGSAGYGRDWRTAIYTHMGGTDLTDQVDGALFLAREYDVDPRRIGLYGGSYGGFITLMAMFLEPDTFAAGAAMRPVTDWAAYNHPYTAGILNTPQDDPDSYLRSSPIYFAEGLRGALLICHGIVDDNVHFQGAVRLVQRLIELRKENWELAVYPVERHGFVEPASWVDEYRRILKLFNENLRDK